MSAEVRLAVQRALDKLINRFGSTSDVIGELRAALAAMDKEETAVPALRPVEAGTAVEPEPEVEAEPPPKKRTSARRKAK